MQKLTWTVLLFCVTMYDFINTCTPTLNDDGQFKWEKNEKNLYLMSGPVSVCDCDIFMSIINTKWINCLFHCSLWRILSQLIHINYVLHVLCAHSQIHRMQFFDCNTRVPLNKSIPDPSVTKWKYFVSIFEKDCQITYYRSVETQTETSFTDRTIYFSLFSHSFLLFVVVVFLNWKLRGTQIGKAIFR